MKKFSKITYQVGNKAPATNEATFVWKPLERGFATTLGNALRRTLLAAVPGAAPFAYSLNQCTHEFQSLSGIYQDLVKVSLNIKRLVIKADPDLFSEGENILLTFTKSNFTGEIKGGDLTCPAGVTVVNKEHVLVTATTCDVNFTIYACTGRGFVTFEDNEHLRRQPDMIIIDSNFNPVERVTFSYKMLPGALSKTEELKLYVKTNGAMTPEETLKFAVQILQAHLAFFNFQPSVSKEAVFVEHEPEQEKKPIMIYDLTLSLRSFNCLKSANINTVDELISHTVSEIRQINNLGLKSWQEISEKVRQLGLSFKGN